MVAMYSVPPEDSLGSVFKVDLGRNVLYQDIESIAPDEIRLICPNSALVTTVLSDTAPAAAELILGAKSSGHFHLPQTLP